MRKGEYRIRAQRFLTGEFRVEDLHYLFLFLRQQSYGKETVADIGNMVGHADARKQGVSMRRVTDHYHIAQYQSVRFEGNPVLRALNIYDAPPNLFDMMDATLRLLASELLLKYTGLRRDQASTALTKLKRRFRDDGNGRLTWTGPNIKPKQVALLDCLTGFIISRPAYDANTFIEETAYLLIKHGFIDEPQRHLLQAKRPHLLLFAIAAMHGARYLLDNGDTVEAEAGWGTDNGDALLRVGASVTVPYRREGIEGTQQWLFSLFETDLKASDWAPDFDAARPNVTWTVPIEVTNDPFIQPIR